MFTHFTAYDALLLFVGMAVVALFAWLYNRRTAQAIRVLTDAARALAQGDFHVEVPIRTRGPAGELSRAFNEMAHQLAAG